MKLFVFVLSVFAVLAVVLGTGTDRTPPRVRRNFEGHKREEGPHVFTLSPLYPYQVRQRSAGRALRPRPATHTQAPAEPIVATAQARRPSRTFENDLKFLRRPTRSVPRGAPGPEPEFADRRPCSMEVQGERHEFRVTFNGRGHPAAGRLLLAYRCARFVALAGFLRRLDRRSSSITYKVV
ncbi:unnamed protein product [Plutella xylostella]|uniref:(diamondback moth) hypothetical protein n=1 Tax=Plutella xylostella TaxID=51655 RepID=A0A8S4GFD4_PLUXY|nr:unnamed protein product [Plutella xylostella]